MRDSRECQNLDTRSEPLREAVSYFMRRLYRQGLTTTSGGNISARIDDHCVAISASKSDKAELRPDQVGIVAMDGTNLTPGLALSIETGMHLAIYRVRPDVKAIVHAHPPVASAFCATAVPINAHLTAEAYAIVGNPAFLAYACMGTQALAETVATGMATAVTALLENHGALAVGVSLLEAFDRLEVLEVAAKHTLITRQLGSVRDIEGERLQELDRLMGRL